MNDCIKPDYDQLVIEYKGGHESLNEFCKMRNISKSAMNYHMYAKHKRKSTKDSHSNHFVKIDLTQDNDVVSSNQIESCKIHYSDFHIDMTKDNIDLVYQLMKRLNHD